MSEMVERVQAAIFDALEKHSMDCQELALQGGRIFYDGDFDAAAIARAAIEAMREPTEAMLAAEVVAWNDKQRGKPAVMLAGECCWKAMIDAALKDRT